MPESFTNVSEGSGKKQHSFQRTIGANTVEDNVVVQGEPYLATYSVSASGLSIAAAGHILQIMAGTSLRVYLRRLRMYQLAAATTAGISAFRLYRLTSAGTGGVAQTPSPLDPADSSSGASAMTAVVTPGTLGVPIWFGSAYFVQTIGASLAPGTLPLLVDLDYRDHGHKAPIIAAGVNNGLVLYSVSAVGGATVLVTSEFSEANF